LRRESTEAEKRLWRALRELGLAKWRRQMPIGPYFPDLTCFASRLVIELDGSQHAEADDYDRARTRFLESQGYRVLRFWNNDVRDNLGGVVAAISQALSPSPSQPSAGSSLGWTAPRAVQRMPGACSTINSLPKGEGQ